ncbi:hypothetical protein ONZ43_g3094 [Nemania bipapillata]|uniref:Uncharacterized protein n=1 Tax=Nemania bipapillata TaxID=110536 RepID=A0ACC2IY53_9PEZI|nr:hypothetical protein ONZ43_g3094 [Nemania bipapillata]
MASRGPRPQAATKAQFASPVLKATKGIRQVFFTRVSPSNGGATSRVQDNAPLLREYEHLDSDIEEDGDHNPPQPLDPNTEDAQPKKKKRTRAKEIAKSVGRGIVMGLECMAIEHTYRSPVYAEWHSKKMAAYWEEKRLKGEEKKRKKEEKRRAKTANASK